MASGIELPNNSFGAEPVDGLMSIQAGAKHEERFRKYVLPQKHLAINKLRQKDKACVRVQDLPYGFVGKNLKEYFKQFGTLIRCAVHKDPRNGKTLGVGYVYFEDANVAQVAAKTMDNYFVCGNLLKCKVLQGDRIRNRFFEQDDDGFHRRNNISIEKVNKIRSGDAEARLKYRRQVMAARALKKLQSDSATVAVTPTHLGLQDIAVKIDTSKLSKLVKKKKNKKIVSAGKVKKTLKKGTAQRPFLKNTLKASDTTVGKVNIAASPKSAKAPKPKILGKPTNKVPKQTILSKPTTKTPKKKILNKTTTKAPKQTILSKTTTKAPKQPNTPQHSVESKDADNKSKKSAIVVQKTEVGATVSTESLKQNKRKSSKLVKKLENKSAAATKINSENKPAESHKEKKVGSKPKNSNTVKKIAVGTVQKHEKSIVKQVTAKKTESAKSTKKSIIKPTDTKKIGADKSTKSKRRVSFGGETVSSQEPPKKKRMNKK